MNSAETNLGGHPNETAQAWEEMAASMRQEGGFAANGPTMMEFSPEMFPAMGEVNDDGGVVLTNTESVSSTEAEQPMEADWREAENGKRLRESVAELEDYWRDIPLSPEAYWKELKEDYAKKGVDVGLMPDVREIRDYATGYFAEKVAGLDEQAQSERVKAAVKATLARMAGAKAEAVKYWQSEGKGLPVTFENELVERGQGDLRNILDAFYGGEGRLVNDAKSSDGLTMDEMVAWQVAQRPQKPGTVNMIWLYERNPQGEHESPGEYYNRLKNYTKQDRMRDWQVEQDQKRMQSEEGLASQGRKSGRPTEYDLGSNTSARQDENGDWVVTTPSKEEEAAEAIRLANEASEEMNAGKREKKVRAVQEKLGMFGRMKRVASRLMGGLKLDGHLPSEEDDAAYYVEMERKAQEKAAEEAAKVAEAAKAAGQAGQAEAPEAVRAEDMAKPETQLEEVTTEVETVQVPKVEMEKPKMSAEEERRARTLERMKDKEKLTTDELMKIRDQAAAVAKRTKGPGRMKYFALVDEMESYILDRRAKEALAAAGRQGAEYNDQVGSFQLEVLKNRGLYSGDMGQKGVTELRTLKADTEGKIIEAVVAGERNLEDEYRSRLNIIRPALRELELLVEANGDSYYDAKVG